MKRLLLVFMLLVTGAAGLTAQRAISGKVTDDKGEALIGASVLVKGTSVGTVSDLDGSFNLQAPAGAAALMVSYTGYLTKEVALTAASSYNVVLASDAVTISEVVVVGYGTQQKRNITGTISSIKGSDIANLAVQSFDQALQGRAAGVNVSIPNGVLNNPPVFRIRGINSINLSSFPLVVIDGVPTFTGDVSGSLSANNPLSNLNPADIESIEILKDASAAAIYGSRAAAGVVLISTKRGQQGKTRVNYDGWASWTSPARLPELLNAQEYVTIKNEAIVNSNQLSNTNLAPQFFLDTLNGQVVDTDWYDFVYRTGFSQNHALSFSGGTEKTNYFLSMGYTNQQGMIVANDFERRSFRLNLDHKMGKFLNIGATAGYSGNINRAPNTGSLAGQAFSTAGLGRVPLITAPNVSPFTATGAYNIRSDNTIGRGRNLVQSGFYNPAPIIDLNRGISQSGQIQASVYAQANLAKGLAFRSQYGLDQLNTEDNIFYTPIHGDGFGQAGFAQNLYRRTDRWNWTNTIQYDATFAEKHNISLLAGNEQQYTKDERWGASRNQIADPFFTTYQGNFTTINPAGNFQGENYFLSYFGRANYDFNKIFLATFNLRQDEFSAFAPGKKRGLFWGSSVGLTLSELDFWKNSLGNVFNYFRLRGSYGQVGNNNGIGDFASLASYSSGLYGPNATLTFSQAGNPDLTWETSKKTDVGINFGMFDDRITGEVTYFLNDIDGLILAAPQAPSKGIPGNSILTNIGRMQNKGIEIGLSGTVLKNSKFSWTTNFNVTFMSNEVLSLAAGGADIFPATSGLERANIIRVGESIGSLFVVETPYVNPANGRRVFLDVNGREVQYSHAVPSGQSRWTYVDNGAAAPAIAQVRDGVVYGPTLPTWFGAWDNTLRYKNFDFNVQAQYSGGNFIYNGTKAGMRDLRFWNNHTDVLTRWQQEGDVTDIPRVVWLDNVSNGSAQPISANVEKGDFLRIRNLTLGYTLPSNSIFQKANISNFRVYVSANNAFLFTAYTGTDPEVSSNGNSNQAPGVDRNSVPMARTLLVGLNLSF
jgi:TonB-linked SusC/RagA family outer membrane protein